MNKVDFFIVGVQKGGTTALDGILRKHPSVQMATKKELHFFDDETCDWSTPDYGLLHEHFDWTIDRVVRGEATPVYIYWPNSMHRLAAYNQDAKIIVCLRHPVHRAHSHWRMEAARNRDKLSFSDAIRGGRERVGEAHRTFSYVERGFYAQQIERTLELFRSVHFMRTDHLWTNTDNQIDQLCRFLCIPSFQYRRKYIAPINTQGGAPISSDDWSYLMNLYAYDVRLTGAITGLDLTDWLDPDYSEPMKA